MAEESRMGGPDGESEWGEDSGSGMGGGGPPQGGSDWGEDDESDWGGGGSDMGGGGPPGPPGRRRNL